MTMVDIRIHARAGIRSRELNDADHCTTEGRSFIFPTYKKEALLFHSNYIYNYLKHSDITYYFMKYEFQGLAIRSSSFVLRMTINI